MINKNIKESYTFYNEKKNIKLLAIIMPLISLLFIFMAIFSTKVKATSFNNSTITYNENQVTKYTSIFNYRCTMINTNSKYMYSCSSTSTTTIYYNGTLTNNVITFPKYKTIDTSGSVNDINSSTTFTIYSEYATIPGSFGSTARVTVLEELTTSTRTEIYNEGYNAGYNAGIQYVVSNPAQYSLYTQEQYNAVSSAGYQEGYNAGLNYVINYPAQYSLYTQSQYNTNASIEYNNGINHVLNNLESYNLYTQEQVNNNASADYNSGYNNGINQVLNNLGNYNLYTQEQYTTNGTNNYNNGYTAGNNAGYENGYLEGVNDTETDSNTLTGLFNAVLTSPVNMIANIFNFEFLGVNISALIFSIVSMFIVIWLIKRFI